LWLGAITPDLLAQAHAHAKSVPSAANGRLRFFTPEEATDFDAFSAQIIPTDDTPGAREANVVHCVDYLLSEFDLEQQGPARAALKDLRDRAIKSSPGAKSFAALTSDQQVEVMKAMEKDAPPHFGVLRGCTIIAFFGDPELGGNTNEVGWKLLQFDSRFMWQPPFGYYDAHAEEDKA
jgi:hypothetical protein